MQVCEVTEIAAPKTLDKSCVVHQYQAPCLSHRPRRRRNYKINLLLIVGCTRTMYYNTVLGRFTPFEASWAVK